MNDQQHIFYMIFISIQYSSDSSMMDYVLNCILEKRPTIYFCMLAVSTVHMRNESFLKPSHRNSSDTFFPQPTFNTSDNRKEIHSLNFLNYKCATTYFKQQHVNYNTNKEDSSMGDQSEQNGKDHNQFSKRLLTRTDEINSSSRNSTGGSNCRDLSSRNNNNNNKGSSSCSN